MYGRSLAFSKRTDDLDQQHPQQMQHSTFEFRLVGNALFNVVDSLLWNSMTSILLYFMHCT
jgi:hypothetical protein